MPTISGPLKYVTDRPAAVTEVWVRAERLRTSGDGVVTSSNDRIPVADGQVSFGALPGPAVLALVESGRPVETVPILVGDAATQSLREVAELGEMAEPERQGEFYELARQVRADAKSASSSATTASTAAGTATSAATTATTAAADAKADAGRSKSDREAAEAAAGVAGKAAGTATTQAGKAKQEADRAANAVATTKWTGDVLSVNGKSSPPLTGPKGQDGTVAFDALTEEQRESLRGEPGKDATAVNIADGSITDAKLADSAVSDVKLASAYRSAHPEVQVYAKGALPSILTAGIIYMERES